MMAGRGSLSSIGHLQVMCRIQYAPFPGVGTISSTPRTRNECVARGRLVREGRGSELADIGSEGGGVRRRTWYALFHGSGTMSSTPRTLNDSVDHGHSVQEGWGSALADRGSAEGGVEEEDMVRTISSPRYDFQHSQDTKRIRCMWAFGLGSTGDQSSTSG